MESDDQKYCRTCVELDNEIYLLMASINRSKFAMEKIANEHVPSEEQNIIKMRRVLGHQKIIVFFNKKILDLETLKNKLTQLHSQEKSATNRTLMLEYINSYNDPRQKARDTEHLLKTMDVFEDTEQIINEAMDTCYESSEDLKNEYNMWKLNNVPQVPLFSADAPITIKYTSVLSNEL